MRSIGNSLRGISRLRDSCGLRHAFRKMHVRLIVLLGLAAWFDCSSAVLADNWNSFTLAGNGSASRGIAAVSRIPTSMEVWWIAPSWDLFGQSVEILQARRHAGLP